MTAAVLRQAPHGCAERIGSVADPITWDEIVHRVQAMHRLRRAAIAEAKRLAAELPDLPQGHERDLTVREIAALRAAASGAVRFAAELHALAVALADAVGA